jgi:outer membrane receptor protein involved in Fe transport
MIFRKMMLAVAAVIVSSLGMLSLRARADETTGKVHGVLFEEENRVPIKNVTLFALDVPESVVEISDGVFELTLPPGRHVLLMHLGEGVVARLGEVDVVAGYSAEVVGSVNENGEVTSYQVEGISRLATVETETPANDSLEQSSIEGRLVNEENGEPIAGARVFVRGQPGEATTDADGRFVFNLPVGVHDVSILHQQYTTVTEKNVSVVSGKATTLDLKATPLGVMLSDFVVTAPRIEGGTASLMEERKESTAVEDVIGAEQMSKTGDSNAASALKRVTGITVVGGKYVYVRGLGERYSSTLFNGAMLPSPEPERRVIPLDMFPAGMLESVVVQKTYSPEMPGEFGGGVVLLRSRNYPSKFVFDISLSGEYLTGTTFTRGWITESGPTDWLGVDGGFRDLPDEFVEATRDQPLEVMDITGNGFSLDELEHLGQLLPKHWKSWKRTVPPNFGLSLSVGNTFKLKNIKLGVLASAMYDNEWENIEPHMITFKIADGVLETGNDYRFETTTNTIKTSGFLATGIEFNEHHRIRSTTILNRITDNMTRWYEGTHREGVTARVYRTRWVERQLLSQQLLGEHVIEHLRNLGINWRYTVSRATRDEPLRQEARQDYEETGGYWRLVATTDGNNTFYSELYDVSHDLGLDLSMPIEFNDRNNLKLYAGTSLLIREREVDTRRYSFMTRANNSFPSSGGPLTYNIEDIFVDDFIGPFTYENISYGGLIVQDVTTKTDNYTADQQVSAGYGKAELELVEDVKLMGGVRVEKSSQSVTTFELFTEPPETVIARLETTDVLPAGTASYEFRDHMVIRGGYGRTVSRPEFREMSPSTFYDVTGGNVTVGNSELQRAVIDNFDLRWDWFFAPGELISVGGFYKKFDEPIEVGLESGADIRVTWRNAKSASNYGLEFDFKKNFDFLSDALKDVYFATNASVIRSKVTLHEEGIQTNDERPLQGQSPYVINCQLGYDNVDTGRSLILLYNVFGKRISAVGGIGLPDIYEQPFHSLNVVAKMKLKDRVKLSFKINNILNRPVEFTQGDSVTWTYRKGVSFSLGAGFSY